MVFILDKIYLDVSPMMKLICLTGFLKYLKTWWCIICNIKWLCMCVCICRSAHTHTHSHTGQNNVRFRWHDQNSWDRLECIFLPETWLELFLTSFAEYYGELCSGITYIIDVIFMCICFICVYIHMYTNVHIFNSNIRQLY